MSGALRLESIPDNRYSDYRYEVIFKAYKWDPQVGDHNTVSKHVVLMDRQTAAQLGEWAEQMSEETMLMEEALLRRLPLAKQLELPNDIYKSLSRSLGYDRSKNVRLMRFDFHPTETGWAVSEVNSDVPGGLAEASVLPVIAGRHFGGYTAYKNVADGLLEAFKAKVKKSGTIAFVHATSYADDRQVMQFLGDYFGANGLNPVFAAPDHIRWNNKRAISIIEGQEGEVDGIVRFFPLEWLVNLPKGSDWKGYYDCSTPSCNHPAAILTQSKRLPLVWDKLGIELPAWKKFLPFTADPKTINPKETDWVYKPALGRVGEGISIKEAVSEKEYKQIEKAARRQPENWVAQRKFYSRPLVTANGEEYHLCVGVFTVDGKCAGFYGRISPYPRIDSNAKDIPILVLKDGKNDER